jgi:hypothetical protein
MNFSEQQLVLTSAMILSASFVLLSLSPSLTVFLAALLPVVISQSVLSTSLTSLLTKVAPHAA